MCVKTRHLTTPLPLENFANKSILKEKKETIPNITTKN
jgi:hypothetical protein